MTGSHGDGMGVETTGALIETLRTADTATRAVRAVQAFAATHGFDAFSYLALGASASAVPYFETTLPQAFAEAYVADNLFEVDPVVALGRARRAAFTWRDAFDEAEADPDAQSRDLYRLRDLLALHRLTDGFAVPCGEARSDGPINGALVSYAWTGAPEEMAHALTAGRDPLQLAAAFLHVVLAGLRQGSSSAASDKVLTLRETECLKWVAAGKTSDEIGTILALRRSTVDFHVNNAIKKLGAASRPHAVAEALRRGLI